MGIGRKVIIARHPDGYYITTGHPELVVQITDDKSKAIEHFIAAVTAEQEDSQEHKATWDDIHELLQISARYLSDAMAKLQPNSTEIIAKMTEFVSSPVVGSYLRVSGGHVFSSMERMVFRKNIEDLIRDAVTLFYERRLEIPKINQAVRSDDGRLTKEEIEALLAPAPAPPPGSESEEPPPPPPQSDREQS